MPGAATPKTVMAAYADLINHHDFSLLVPLIDSDAVFWFSSGSFTGIDAIRSVFERTWQRLENETYWNGISRLGLFKSRRHSRESGNPVCCDKFSAFSATTQ
ncbi:hypothetical protein ASG47_16185 [Devosia sp. Leaf420]|uniref:nuclear transport factor 2 family protein n=1 Tax=Devosia sp. Leaf420 TaxID=1736374 RepID=UPI000713EDC3|nr:nuclear transport factor 2 family protein [Devosia sp. Leaf420]KQT44960.1 hypothetical protein ASG47_16185 [Devosia sp. Leaf420]